MNKITLVGCGFVGSVFVDEMLKRQFAGKLPQGWRMIDFDKVSERNCANQNFILDDNGKYKSDVLSERAMKSGKMTESVTTRLTEENINELLADSVLIIDGVDKLAVRQLLWGYAMSNGIPVLHLGIAEVGTGKVEWTHPKHDTFTLSPAHTFGKEVVDPPSGITPPCELARMRGVGLNVGFAAATAAAIYLGFDPESHLNGEQPQHWMTEWAGTQMSHYPVKDTWGQVLPDVTD